MLDLARRIGQADTILDLGCGYNASPVSNQVLKISCSKLVSVDAHPPCIMHLTNSDAAAKDWDIQMSDIISYVENMQTDFDCVLLLDVLEHLTKTDGQDLLANLKQHTKRIVIWLPLGNCPQDPYDGNERQLHQSTWHENDLMALGFNVEVLRNFHTQFDPPVSAGWAIWESR